MCVFQKTEFSRKLNFPPFDSDSIVFVINTPDARAGPTGAFFAERGDQAPGKLVEPPEPCTIR